MKKIFVMFFLISAVAAFAKGNKENPVFIETDAVQYVSPNGDGVQDDVQLKFKITIYLRSIAGFIPKYGVQIISEKKDVVRAITNNEKKDLVGIQAWGKPYEPFNLTREIYWDAKDGKGKTVPDGKYTVRAWAIDANNNRSQTDIGQLIVDTVAPVANISTTKGTIFSPNGDGFRDVAVIKQSGDTEAQWTIKIENDQDEPVRIIKLIDSPLSDWEWDGTDDSGRLSPDGKYRYKLIGEDYAGNSSETYIVENIILDTKNTAMKITPRYAGFSSKGVRPTLDVDITYALKDEFVSWGYELTPKDSKDAVLAVKETNKSLPDLITLNGKDSEGNYLADGVYTLTYWTEYENGDISKYAANIVIDNVAPTVGLDSIGNPFAKAEDGVKGDYFITVDAKDDSALNNWDLEIISKDGTPIKVFAGEGNPSKIIAWNTTEKDDYIDEMLDNRFFVEVKVVDIAGNETIFKKPITLDVLVIERDGKYYLMVPNIIFDMYNHKLDSKGKKMFERNKKSIQKVVEIYNRYSAYNIILEAHALNVFEKGTANYEREEKILLPLTRKRADEVATYLVKYGFNDLKIKESPCGSKYPLVNPKDKVNNWKNRRVEFIMEMKKQNELLDLSKKEIDTATKDAKKTNKKSEVSLSVEIDDGDQF